MEPADPLAGLREDYPWVQVDIRPLLRQKVPKEYRHLSTADNSDAWQDLFEAYLRSYSRDHARARKDLADLFALRRSDAVAFSQAAWREKTTPIALADDIFTEPYAMFCRLFENLQERIGENATLRQAFRRGDEGTSRAAKVAAANAAAELNLGTIGDLRQTLAKVEEHAASFDSLVDTFTTIEGRLRFMYKAQGKSPTIVTRLTSLKQRHDATVVVLRELCTYGRKSPDDREVPDFSAVDVRKVMTTYYTVLNDLMSTIQDKIAPELEDIWYTRTVKLLESGYGKLDDYRQDYEVLDLAKMMSMPTKVMLSLAAPVPFVGAALGTLEKVALGAAEAAMNRAEARLKAFDVAVQQKYAEFLTAEEQRVLANRRGEDEEGPDALEIAEGVHGDLEDAESLAHYGASIIKVVADFGTEHTQEALHALLEHVEPGLFAATVAGPLAGQALAAMKTYQLAVKLYGPTSRNTRDQARLLVETVEAARKARAGTGRSVQVSEAEKIRPAMSQEERERKQAYFGGPPKIAKPWSAMSEDELAALPDKERKAALEARRDRAKQPAAPLQGKAKTDATNKGRGILSKLVKK